MKQCCHFSPRNPSSRFTIVSGNDSLPIAPSSRGFHRRLLSVFVPICSGSSSSTPHFNKKPGPSLEEISETMGLALFQVYQVLSKMSVSVACKPSSVIGGHLSRPVVANGFKRNPESSTGRLKRSFVSCCEWGLHRGRVARPRVSSYLTFPSLHALRRAVSLCCTFPGVAPAGRYPALCPMQLGLSSHLPARGRPAASQTVGLYHILQRLSTAGQRDEREQLLIDRIRILKMDVRGIPAF